ncbi:retinal pigment epithelial membrane protein [Polymorphobacter glacialis]|uniref:Dioxygenase n=1 Tax=Sandarakinorhabdus glacialis TaxID=1614636 RepID=A0A917E5G9_9SPHN|nr:carotenoid oxygenase family protein [Polymorphobacter glacialis]GGE02627.1 retinal pigment epithelial membrane protein [Polymorphobacter glacialis]
MATDMAIREPVTTLEHPFLSGMHRPMTSEVSLENLRVTGTIPPTLDGRYLRMGPNPIDADASKYHWFSGDGMVHGLAIKDGQALWYRNRWIRSKRAAALLCEDAAPGPRHGISDNVNTNVASIGGRTFAMVEAGSFPVELSASLQEQAYNPFGGTLKGSFTAHPHRDPLTGEHHAITYDAMAPTLVHHVVISAAGAVIREESVAVEHGPSIHDSAFTARYALILDLPVTFSMEAAIGGFGFPYRWNKDHQARIGLLPRNGAGTDTIWVDVEPCYIFHVANAYDRADGKVVLDAVVYDRMFADSTEGPDNSPRGFERWIIDPVARTTERFTIDSAAQEFPRPDERLFGQPYRYAYTLGLPATDSAFLGATFLIKHDLSADLGPGAREIHDFGPGRYPGEFVFVPAAADAEEDHGWLIGLVVDLPTESTELVILDAHDFTAAPVARVHLPHRVPPGFHGNWIAA